MLKRLFQRPRASAPTEPTVEGRRPGLPRGVRVYAIGDLHVLGQPLLAAYSAYRSGHALNNRLLRALLADPAAHETVSFDDEALAPRGFAELAPAW